MFANINVKNMFWTRLRMLKFLVCSRQFLKNSRRFFHSPKVFVLKNNFKVISEDRIQILRWKIEKIEISCDDLIIYSRVTFLFFLQNLPPVRSFSGTLHIHLSWAIFLSCTFIPSFTFMNFKHLFRFLEKIQRFWGLQDTFSGQKWQKATLRHLPILMSI